MLSIAGAAVATGALGAATTGGGGAIGAGAGVGAEVQAAKVSAVEMSRASLVGFIFSFR